MADSTLTQRRDFLSELRAIRQALHIGLESFGEIERVTNEFDLRRTFDSGLAKELRPVHPTGAADTIGQFAAALRLLDSLEDGADKLFPSSEVSHG